MYKILLVEIPGMVRARFDMIGINPTIPNLALTIPGSL